MKKIQSYLRYISTTLIMIFILQLFLGHEGGLVQTFVDHITGRLPIPWWDYVILIFGIFALVFSRRVKN